uniref:HD domain-containing protein n=1 Tax=Chromera velia CCMP2878 TaxID=1169474 RepID=A0A0G4GA36_9ALVE|eukprot:Cvel_20933.t1-p1 / transcript=Cvel_20933.t1 / gene=Cvel_20933 / organism=Chromera_velia_CCMP2878 / gene_product=hypothetical protein / transcript_product=hypothetical protein / location=Cvel_scaffold1922:14937-16592(-) / protein_length=210 / sequence_SO=supercontig / SO=protein_coding / is_pseudo=false
MQTVARRSNRIARLLPADELGGVTRGDAVLLCTVVGWLHDVSDHKYSEVKSLRWFINRMEGLLHSLGCLPYWGFVQDAIDRISFSREKRKGQEDWGQLGHWLIVRHIVSDADKIEALGEVGVERCVGYKLSRLRAEELREAEAAVVSRVRKEVREHADEKLLLLKDQYIRTSVGRKLAEGPHSELAAVIKGDELDHFIRKQLLALLRLTA